MTAARGWHGLEQFSADGTGHIALYKGQTCTGDLVGAPYDFLWDVRGGILTTHSLHTPVAYDTDNLIKFIDATRMVLRSKEGESFYREKTSGCDKAN